MSSPLKVGQPCWTPPQVARVISLTAHTTSHSAPFFLATHSPFKRIHDGKAPGRALGEEEVFSEIFSTARGEVQAFIKGDPGTGKSHLIRWLSLRSEYAATKKQFDLHNYKLVLVRRGNGSLKDALKQIVDQLGPEFKKHSQRVQGAIEKLSDGTARAKLVSELALEVDQRWGERGRDPLPKSLKHLGQALRASGFGGWLQREGGTIAQIVRMLTQSSTPEERENSPQFTADEFKLPPKYVGPTNNSTEVLALAEDLGLEEERRKKAADVLNTALRHAIGELTDLRGSDLLEIFTEIRRSLHKQKKELAIFIEDVSTTPGLFDQEVVQAFEPNPGDGLCRMVAVLGITNAGWGKMQENRIQRATHVYEVGGTVDQQWATDPEEVGRFTARYLNATRLSEQETVAIAEERFKGDIRRSKCDKCSVRTECHAAFGTVELETGAVIGMFPFTPRAPQALLQALVDARYRSQRGLLDRVLMPGIGQSDTALAEGAFPRQSLFNVHARALLFWQAFEGKYCGGPMWDDEQRGRLKFLAQFWADAKTTDELAGQLQPLLAPLSFPAFLGGARPVPPKAAPDKKPSSPKVSMTEDPDVQKLFTYLDEWKSGKPLREDNRFRELLGKFLRYSMRWQDERDIPVRVAQDHVDGGKAYPRIEGQVQKVTGQLFFIDFPKNKETYALLQALVLFNHAGSSWNFDHGEVHKRTVSRWIRRNREAVLHSLKPSPKDPSKSALVAAVNVLAVASLIRDRKQFSNIDASALNRVLDAPWTEETRPAALSDDLNDLIEDLEAKHRGLVDFIVQETGAGQGTAVPSDFINAAPVLEALEGFMKKGSVEPPSDTVKENFWKSRFVAVSKLASYGDLRDVLSGEREKLTEIVEAANAFLKGCGFPQGDIEQSLQSCIKQFIEIVELQQKHDVLPLHLSEEFESVWQSRVLHTKAKEWATALVEAKELAHGKESIELLAFDSRSLVEFSKVLQIVEHYVALVERELKKEEANFGKGSATKCEAVLQELAEIGALAAARPEEKKR